MPTKRKQNYAAPEGGVAGQDLFATPAYALDPLLPYLKGLNPVWEPACGEGYLARALRAAGKYVFAEDIQIREDYNYFESLRPEAAQVQVTNVPFSCKYRWLAKACAEGVPFALLMPSDVLFAGVKFQPLMRRYDLRLLVPDKRINFGTPSWGWKSPDGKKSSAQMHTSWVTMGLGLPERLTFCEITPRDEPPLLDDERLLPPTRLMKEAA